MSSLGSGSSTQSPTDDGQAPLASTLAWDNSYQLQEGVCVLPVALTDDEVAAGVSPVLVGRLHPPYRIRTLNYRAAKQNAPPVMPTPKSAGAFVFVGGSFDIPAPTQNQTYTVFDWEATARYVFVEDVQSDRADGFVIGTPPYTLPTMAANAGTGVQPPSGAGKFAGPDAWVGYAQGLAAQGAGIASGAWNYNCQSFYSGAFFNDTISNAGGA